MAIDWSMARSPDIIGNALNAFEQGKQMRREESARNALGTLVQNPNDTKAFGTLASASPEIAMKFRENQVAVAKAQREQQMQQVQVMGNLLGQANDETSYQTALSAAKLHGIDTTGAPTNYDPKWVDGMRMVVQAYQKDGGAKLTSLAQNLVALGYKPGTPEFRSQLAAGMNSEYAKPYIDASGATRLHTPNIIAPAQGSQPARNVASIIPQRPAGMSDAQLWKQAHEAVRKGANVDDVFRQLQAWGVNP